MPRATRFSSQKKATFLETLRETCNVSRAAAAAGISRSAAYACRRREPAFARAWDEAIDSALDSLEEELLRRAREGVERPVHYQGKLIAKTRNYSDQLAMFLLKARRPEIFGDGDGEHKHGVDRIRDARTSLERKLARLAADGPAVDTSEKPDGSGSIDSAS